MTTSLVNDKVKKIHEVVAIIDRSGSMTGKEEDTIGGINTTLEVLREEEDSDTITNISIKLFDDKEKMLIRSMNLNNVKPLQRKNFVPRGQTALLDAIGNTLNYFMTKKIENENSYNICSIYIVTDGFENASKNYTSKKIKRMIAEVEENYNIKLLYLAANQDAIFEAGKFGINSSSALNYSENSENINSAYRSAASSIRRHYAGEDSSFTQAERQSSQSQEPPLLRRMSRISSSSRPLYWDWIE